MPKSFSARIFVALIVISVSWSLETPYSALSHAHSTVCSVSVSRMCGSETQNQASGVTGNHVSKFAIHPCRGGADEYS